MRIEVTEADIANGIPSDYCSCPIALAMKRQLGVRWIVTRSAAENEDGGRVNLPAECGQFICNFDRGKKVEPFAFEIADR